MASKFVQAYSKATGRIHSVPEHFIGHPKLGRDLELTPRQAAVDVTGTPDLPDESWTVVQLRAYAAEQDVDLDGATRKDDVLAAIEAYLASLSDLTPTPVAPGDTTTTRPAGDTEEE